MKPTRRNHPWVLLGTAATSLVVACHFEPFTPELVFSENTKAVEDNNLLADDANAREHLAGSLDFLFGSPSNPSYTVLPDWLDEEFDPNSWGYFSLTDEEFDALKASNAKAYAWELQAIEEGRIHELLERYHTTGQPRYVDDLMANVEALASSVQSFEPKPEDAGDDYVPVPVLDDEGHAVYDLDQEFDEDWTYRDELASMFEGYYPSMRTSAEMYRVQCYHCHGASGGGDGSTADFLNPRPRDYRPGKFKFTALKDKARPRHRDLMRILEEGIYTSAMPSFRRFTDAQLSGLADYVRLLAIRGETEILMATDFDPDAGIHFENLQENYELVVNFWRDTEDKLIVYEDEVPHSTPEAIERGKDLYMRADAANCVKCHGMLGRGDGESVKSNPQDAIDDWGYQITPRDLTRNVYRFGRRPIDIYRRIYAGINGTPMPAHYDMQIVDGDGETRKLNEDDVWDLVYYVRSLATKEMEEAAPAADHGGEATDEHGEAEGH